MLLGCLHRDILDKGKELPEMEPLDYVIRNDEKIFLEEQLKPRPVQFIH